VTALDSSKPVAVQLTAPCDASLIKSEPKSVVLPSIESVDVIQPAVAPEIVIGGSTPQQAAVFASAYANLASQAVAPGDKTGEDKKVEPKPDERTWLQKNWVFVALGLYFVMNRINAGGGGEGGSPGSSGPPRTAQAPARR